MPLKPPSIASQDHHQIYPDTLIDHDPAQDAAIAVADERIKKVGEPDPILCPTWSWEMQIVSLIDGEGDKRGGGQKGSTEVDA